MKSVAQLLAQVAPELAAALAEDPEGNVVTVVNAI